MDTTIEDSAEYDLPGWETGPDGLVLYVRSRNTRLNIHVESPDFHRSPTALGNLFSMVAKSDSDDTDPDLWDYLDWVVSHFLAELRHIAPQVNHTGKLTLADLQCCHYYQCRLEFHDESPQPGAIMRRKQREHDDWDIGEFAPPPEWPFPRFQLSDVVVRYSDPTTVFDIIPGNVFVHGQPFFWKPSWMSVELGVDKYCKIHTSGLPPDQLRTSRLYGMVVDSNGALRGQLYHWIDIEKYLTWDVLEQAPEATRVKWLAQIQRTVAILHGLNIIWGDVKAENVVIDKDENAVVIDMEGGVTRGWVDEDKIGTREGDLQGLERLADYITNDECPLRVRDKELDLDDPVDIAL